MTLIFLQAFASAGSAGQAAYLFLYRKKPKKNKRRPVTEKNHDLCFNKTNIIGNCSVKDANTAPAPKVTKRAGSAQQIRVPPLEKSDRYVNMEIFESFTYSSE
jgi:hypothetical protein